MTPNYCVIYQVLVATNAGSPKSTVAPYVMLTDTFTNSVVHVGAATDPDDYDYVVRVAHPTFGLGPFGHFGL